MLSQAPGVAIKNWRDLYNSKLCTAEEAALRIKSGDSIFTAGFSAMPYDFTEALAKRKNELENVEYYGCLAPYLFKMLDSEFNLIHVRDVDAIIETEVPIPQLPSAPATDIENQIASHVVPLVADGSTIQIGIGGVPGAVATSLATKKDLGIHTEMLTDAMFHLVKTGAVTGARKNLHPGKIVYGFAAGSAELLEYLDDNPACIIRPLSETINSHLCGLNDNFVSINTCLMVSITGQVASEAVDWVQISGTGGQLDLVRAARNSKGGKSFIVLESTRTLKSGERISTITSGLPPGTPVTTPRTDVEYVATEYGVVNLRYKSKLRERSPGRVRSSRGLPSTTRPCAQAPLITRICRKMIWTYQEALRSPRRCTRAHPGSTTFPISRPPGLRSLRRQLHG